MQTFTGEYADRVLNSIANDKNHRYLSWEHCYFAFGNNNADNDFLALHLAFYLASWGMYRGSSGLLWKDYKVHIPAINILKQYSHLRNDSYISNPNYVNDILELSEKLEKLYGAIQCYKEENKDSSADVAKVNPTATLISKIILGTLGCMPALDRYFCIGFFNSVQENTTEENSKEERETIDHPRKSKANITDKNLIKIKEFAVGNQEKILQFSKNRKNYPIMKIIDMEFWEKGFDAVMKNNTKKTVMSSPLEMKNPYSSTILKGMDTNNK